MKQIFKIFTTNKPLSIDKSIVGRSAKAKGTVPAELKNISKPDLSGAPKNDKVEFHNNEPSRGEKVTMVYNSANPEKMHIKTVFRLNPSEYSVSTDTQPGEHVLSGEVIGKEMYSKVKSKIWENMKASVRNVRDSKNRLNPIIITDYTVHPVE